MHLNFAQYTIKPTNILPQIMLIFFFRYSVLVLFGLLLYTIFCLHLKEEEEKKFALAIGNLIEKHRRKLNDPSTERILHTLDEILYTIAEKKMCKLFLFCCVKIGITSKWLKRGAKKKERNKHQ